MKNILTAIVAILMMVGVAQAETEVTSHVFSQEGFVYHDKPVIQTEVFTYYDSGLYTVLWASFGLDDADLSSNWGDEMDYVIGWYGHVKGQRLDLSLAYFDTWDIGHVPNGDLIQAKAVYGLGQWYINGHSLRRSVGVKYRHEAKGNEDGFYTSLNLRHDRALTQALTVGQDFTITHDSGVCGADEGIIGKYGFDMNYTIASGIDLDLVKPK
jgi:hypothetical protein